MQNDANATTGTISADTFWNQWNTGARREVGLDDVSRRQSAMILDRLRAFHRTDLQILETGCGSGWMCERMSAFGHVTGVDLADEVIAKAQTRMPHVKFIAGDFMNLDVADTSLDAVVSIETLPHIPDQAGYIAKVARVLRPGGVFCIASQNAVVFRQERWPPPKGGYRRWVDRSELKNLIEPHLSIELLTTIEPHAKHGPLRWLGARRVRKLMNTVTADLYQRTLESAGWGRSIVCLARRA